MFNINGRKALVTGSSQGIGRGIAKALAAYGAEVFVYASQSIDKAEAVAEEIRLNGGLAHPVVGDLADENCAGQLYGQTGAVDILVLNASVQFRSPWNEITPAQAQAQVQVNLLSSLYCIQKYEPAMAAKGFGRIVTIGSVPQYRPHKDMLVYAATKNAQLSLVRNLAKQLGPKGITVNNVAPGVIVTQRNEEALHDENYKQAVLAGIPCAFLGDEQDCAAAVVMLCGPGARYITGVDIPVDGGMSL
ncbi:MAG: SDR family NAD(P)-dependent oxidoreductase [Oscillospiraceae bacterium]